MALSSGHNLTIPVAMYKGITPPYWNQNDGATSINIKEQENAYARQLLSTTNGYNLPIYFRTDIGYSFVKIGKKYTSDLTIGIFNLFNSQNAYLIFNEDNTWKQLSILPLIPSIKWTVGF